MNQRLNQYRSEANNERRDHQPVRTNQNQRHYRDHSAEIHGGGVKTVHDHYPTIQSQNHSSTAWCDRNDHPPEESPSQCQSWGWDDLKLHADTSARAFRHHQNQQLQQQTRSEKKVGRRSLAPGGKSYMSDQNSAQENRSAAHRPVLKTLVKANLP